MSQDGAGHYEGDYWPLFLNHLFETRVKGAAASKYGLASQPRLVDIIAAVPQAYRKVIFTL